ncbi:MAG: class II glutamine amidotransferase [Gammaproteobacteria bacterium]|nr:class II glutamine amidotransferase [Gammaproteobacteria bacterium]
MCGLFAMSSKVPSTVNYSLDEFAKHGGVTYSNRSGWGIAYYHDRDAFLVKEPEPAADSPWAKFISEQDVESDSVIAHVRLATIGTPTLQNTHPFKRELGGHAHVFAHNGTLNGLHDKVSADKLAYHPIGDTDSELAFCVLLDRLKSVWTSPRRIPSAEDRLAAFADFAAEMAGFGSVNFLYSDGDILFVHGHRRIYESNGQFTDPQPPGLSMRNCMACQRTPNGRVKG